MPRKRTATPLVFAVVVVVAVFLSARASCSNHDLIPYLGKWTGGFTVDSISGRPATPAAAKRASLFGYVMIYAMRQTFKLHLEGAQEVLDLAGSWTLHGHRLTLTTTDIKIDDEGGIASRDPNLPYIPSDDVHATYARALVLDLSANRQRLVGLPVSMGNSVGRHEFARD
jgi:hypothetical protein